MELQFFFSASALGFFLALDIFEAIAEEAGPRGKVENETPNLDGKIQQFTPSKLVLMALKKIAPSTSEGRDFL